MKKSIVFDMDGIIFDSEQLVLRTWKHYAPEYGLNNIEESFLKCVGTTRESTKKTMEKIYGTDFNYIEFRDKASELFHKTAEEEGLPLKKGVEELLNYLKEEEYVIGLASSTRIEIVTKELKEAGLYEYFNTIMGGDLLQRSKPYPDIYLMTCEKMNVDPKDTYAVEDSYNGIRSAYSAAMKPIMVPDLLPSTDEMREKAIIILHDLIQVKDYLKRK